MSRYLFGGGVADYAVAIETSTHRLQAAAGRVLKFYPTATGGVQITDLRAADGTTPITTVATNSDGTIPRFYGPDGATQLWADGGGASRSLMVTNDPAAMVPPAASAAAWFPEAFGAVGNGAADDTAAVNAAIAAAQAAGGTVYFQAGKTYRCNAALVFGTGGTSAYPTQNPVRLTSASGAAWNGYWQAPSTAEAAVLDLRYDGTDGVYPSKIFTYGAGKLEIDRLTLKSGGADNLVMIRTTNTTVHVHDCAFIGNSAHTGATCVQDAIQLGGTTSTIGNGVNAPFQGYGTVIERNFFDRIRECVVMQTYANAVCVYDNTVSLTCGSADTTHAAFRSDGGSGGPNAGCTIRGNCIEQTNYPYGVILDHAVNHIVENNHWDAPAALAAVRCTANAYQNLIIGGQNNNGASELVSEATLATNTIINAGTEKTRFQFAGAPVDAIGTSAGQRFFASAKQQWGNAYTDAPDVTVSRSGGAGNPRMTWQATSGTIFEFFISEAHIGQPTNYAAVGSLGTSDAWVDANGSNANVSLMLRAKGTGAIKTRAPLQLDTAGQVSASAAAGSGAAPPATVQGYFVIYDNAGVARKVPYYA